MSDLCLLCVADCLQQNVLLRIARLAKVAIGFPLTHFTTHARGEQAKTHDRHNGYSKQQLLRHPTTHKIVAALPLMRSLRREHRRYVVHSHEQIAVSLVSPGLLEEMCSAQRRDSTAHV